MRISVNFYITSNLKVNYLKETLISIKFTFVAVVEQLFVNVPINVWKLVLMVLVTLILVLKFCRQPFISYINDENEKLE